MDKWANFFVAIVSAAATLTGLMFVGISINLTRILSVPYLPGRASRSLILLLTALIISSLCLVPGQATNLVGLELLFIGIIVWIVTLRIDIRNLIKTEARYKKYTVFNMIFTQLATLPYIIAGITILNHGFIGIYWFIPGCLFSFVTAVTDAWVLLVEINR